MLVQEWTFTISLPNFLFSDLYFCLYLYCFFGNASHTPFDYNLSCRIMKCKNKIQKRSDFIKMPLGEGPATMGFQVSFKCVGFFAVIKSNRIFDTDGIWMCAAHRLCYVFQGGISDLRYSRCRNGFRLLHPREYKRSGS